MELTQRRTPSSLPAQLLEEPRVAELADWGHRLSDLGISHAASGNLSTRLGDGFLITGTGMPLGAIHEGDWVHVTGVIPREDGGLVVESHGPVEPSRDAGVHAAIYGRVPDAMTVFHLHPEYLATLSVDLGVPTTSTYQQAGTVESVREIEQWIDPNTGYLVIVDHGIVAWADTVAAAGELVERYHRLATGA